MEEIETMIKLDEAINAMHNHELYIHGIAHDYSSINTWNSKHYSNTIHNLQTKYE